jgi:hypothetical protein
MQFSLILIAVSLLASAVKDTAKREEKKRKGDCNNEPLE